MKFANNDTDISFAYLMSYRLYLEEDPKTLIFQDEIPMFTSFKVYMEDDVLYPKIIKHKMNFGHIPMKSKPTKTTFDVTKNEYNKYLTDMRMTMDELKKMFNDIQFIDGIKFPYGNNEFKTTFKFFKDSINIFIIVENNAAQFFEEEFSED